MSHDHWGEWISAGLDGELTPEEQRMLDEHLAQCPHCRREWEAGMAIKESFSEEEPPEDLTMQIMGRIRQEGALKKPSRRQNFRRWGSVAAAVIIVVAAFGIGGVYWQSGSSEGMEAAAGGSTEPMEGVSDNVFYYQTNSNSAMESGGDAGPASPDGSLGDPSVTRTEESMDVADPKKEFGLLAGAQPAEDGWVLLVEGEVPQVLSGLTPVEENGNLLYLNCTAVQLEKTLEEAALNSWSNRLIPAADQDTPEGEGGKIIVVPLEN